MAAPTWKRIGIEPAPTSRKTRVLHVHVLPADYGSGLNTFLSMRYLDRSRYETALACAPGGRLEEMVRAEGLEFIPIRSFVRRIDPTHDVPALFELVRAIRRGGFDLVHTHNSKGGILGRLAARWAGVPVVHTVHGFAFHDGEPAWRQTLYREVERRAARWTDALIAISSPLIEWADREQVAPASRFVRIPSGIELSRFLAPVSRAAMRRKLGIDDGELVIGEVAKLWEGKGHQLLFEAFAEIADAAPPARLVLIGEGPLEADLRALAKRLGISDRVTFLGHRSDVDQLLAAFDIAVLPSEFEGMGRAVLEAMARGVAVVASRVGGIPDLVRDRETGILITPRNRDELAAALFQLMEDGSLRRRFGERGRHSVLSDRSGFDARRMAERIEEVYRSVLAGRHSQPAPPARRAERPALPNLGSQWPTPR